MAGKNYWLMKSEPTEYSIDDLKRDQKTFWQGVRNFQARNFMRDQMQAGDHVLFYHSNAEPSGVAGIAKVVRTGYPDFTAWDKHSDYFDAKATPQNPIWYMVDVSFVEKFPQLISLEDLHHESSLKDMLVLKRGSRLSVQPVTREHFEKIRKMSQPKRPQKKS